MMDLADSDALLQLPNHPDIPLLSTHTTSNLPFSTLCELFERCTRIKHSKKKDLLQKFFNKYKNNDYFSLMRLLLPQLDKERQTYGLKETMLGKYYVEILNISPTGEDGMRLLNWRKPMRTLQGQLEGGDFGVAVYLSLKNRCPEKGSCSIDDINNHLDELNLATERKDRGKILQTLLRKTSAIEQKWIVRIILKELKIGLSEKSILNFYHEDAIDLYNVTCNLRKVCQVLKDPQLRISSESIGLFHPIKPMLGSRHLPEQVVKLMDGHDFVIETKYDGERLQVHKDGDIIKCFSRNANDCTSIYGDKLTPLILEHVKVNQCILDGELLVWDTILEKFEEFGRLKTFAKFDDGKRVADIGQNYGKQLCYMIFDVLFVNGKQIMDLTLRQRVALLKRCIPTTKPKFIEVAPQKSAETTAHIIDALDSAIMNGEEGIVIKNLDSVYRPNERKEKWIKLKPEYLDGIGDTLDLLILGGYYGAGVGRRGGTISHFLVGVQHSPSLFYSVARVGSGYSDEELGELQKSLAPYWNTYNPKSPPSVFLLADQCKDKPNVWIEPKHSKILEIKAAQIVPSDKYKAGFTLRFPRVVKIRNDKSFRECITVDELVSLSKLFEGRLSKRRQLGDDADENENKKVKRKKLMVPRKPFAVASNFKAADLSAIKIEGDLFGNMLFCVMNGDDEFSKEEIEILIHQYGGSTTQCPTRDTNAVIAAKQTLKIKNIEQKGDMDIVKPKWILDSIGKESLLPLEPRYMIFTSPATKIIFENDIDKYGDSYTTETTVEHLRETFRIMKVQEEPSNQSQCHSDNKVISQTLDIAPPTIIPLNISKKEMDVDPTRLSHKYFDNPFWCIFHKYVIYLDRYHTPPSTKQAIMFSNLDLCEKLIKFYGKSNDSLTNTITSETTHIVVDIKNDFSNITESDRERYKFILAEIKKCKKNIHVVSSLWILESVSKRHDLDESPFLVDLGMVAEDVVEDSYLNWG